jgi:ankyrin repeat protein
MHQADQVTIELTVAIKDGDVPALERLLAARPGLAAERITGRKGGTSTPLHIVTDWPGYFPNGPAIVRILIEADADPNALTSPGKPETPLHYAASSDDADVAEALINGGADLEVPGGSIGTPLDNAVGYGCWHVARLLVAGPAAEELNEAFSQACHGGQRRAAELLLNQGADPVRIPDYASGQTPVEVAGALDTRRENLVGWLRERTGA